MDSAASLPSIPRRRRRRPSEARKFVYGEKLREAAGPRDMSLDYTHACERAELLGLPVPTEEEWLESRKAEGSQPDGEAVVDDVAENLKTSDESAKRIGGGLDELNSILNVTQKKLNRFKTVCGSLSTLLKVRSRGGTPDHKPVDRRAKEEEDVAKETIVSDENITVELPDETKAPVNSTNSSQHGSSLSKAKDINEKMGSHLDKLDSLITKTEKAQCSMQHQTKQMRRFLK